MLNSRLNEGNEEDEEEEYGTTYKGLRYRAEKNYGTSWGPANFKKGNHPLAIMVCHLSSRSLPNNLIICRWRVSV